MCMSQYVPVSQFALVFVTIQTSLLLGIAAKHGQVDVVRYLVEEKEADLDVVIYGE